MTVAPKKIQRKEATNTLIVNVPLSMVNEKKMQGQYPQITSSIHGKKNPKNAPLLPLRVKWGSKTHLIILFL